MKTAEEIFEEGSVLVRDYRGHEQMLMNEGTFIELFNKYATPPKTEERREEEICGVHYHIRMIKEGNFACPTCKEDIVD